MPRSTALRTVVATVLGLGTAVALAGCFAPAPVVTETPKPEPTGFSTIGGETPVPIETDVPIDPVDPGSAGFTSILDDLGVVTVAVPDSWTDVDGEGFTSNAGQQWAYLAAAPDLDGYHSTWATSGVEVGATAIQSVDAAVLDGQLKSLLADVAQGYAECDSVAADAQPYDDGFFVGYESLFEGCGQNDTVGFAITVVNNAGTQVMFVRGQITQDDDVQAIYTAITGSFDTSIGRSATRSAR